MMGDLVVVAADGGIEQAIRGLLSRRESLGIRGPEDVEFPKLKQLDSGAFLRGSELARLYKETHEHALVIFDLAWEGRPTDDPRELEEQVEAQLAPDWGPKGRCVVIDPELEVWIWSDSPHVASVLGWNSMDELRAWLAAEGLWMAGEDKPRDPKEAYLRAIREKRIQKSNAAFRSLAERVGLRRCRDRSFGRLRDVLQSWYAE